MSATDTKPRGRVKIACEECRKGKRKCDGQKPICSLCQRSGRVCVFSSEESRKRKYQDDDLIPKLEAQIANLKSALEEAKASGGDSSAIYDNDERSSLVPSSCVDVDKSGMLEDAVARSPVAMEELATLMLKMNVEERGEPSFTIASRKDKALPTDFRYPADGRYDPHQTIGHLRAEDRHHLLQCFSKHFNIYHQFLSPGDASDLASPEHDSVGLDYIFREQALFAVAASFSPHAELSKARSQYASFAEGLALRCMKEQPSDLVVQGLTLLSWNELMFGSPDMAYNWIAMATGQVLNLGLHVGVLVRSSSQLIADDMLHSRRVRSFWAYFSVDRLVTSSLGMNCTMHWQRVKVPSFLSTITSQPSVDEVAHERFCHLWHLWDSCMDQVYAFGWADLTQTEKEALVLRSHKALTTFYQENDERLQESIGTMPDSVVWLRLSYNAALILIHRPLLNEPSHSSAGKFALRAATTAAASTSRLIRMYRKTRSLKTNGPQIMDYILPAAVIHLLNATVGKTLLGRQSANGLRSCLDALSEMQSMWSQRTQKVINLIKGLAHKWEVVWAMPIQFSQLQIPGDTFEEGNTRGSVYASTGLMQGFNALDDLAMDGSLENLWQSSSLSETILWGDDSDMYNLDWLFGAGQEYE